jgi:ubiquinone/menaquinone biosynthesis C-methylase UbiE
MARLSGERAAPDWGVGNYERTADLLLPAAEVLVDAAELRAGERVLDLGSGTGNAAILSAAAGTRVTAVDPSQRLLGVAQQTAAERGLDLTCLVGDAAHLPVPDASVDCVVSNFGIIFASDPKAAAAEVARVLTTEGRMVFTAWLPGGAAGALSAMAQDLVREALGAGSSPPGFAWHDTTAVAKLFASHAMQVDRLARRALTFTASSPEVYLDTELSNHPMAIAALKVLRDRGVDKVGRDRLLQVVKEENEDSGKFRSTAQYVVLLGRRGAFPSH